ncbi:hypothetical protein D3C75_971280 [compost metagenome]
MKMVGDGFFVVAAPFKMIIHPAKRHILALKLRVGIQYSQFLFKSQHITPPVFSCYIQVSHYTTERKRGTIRHRFSNPKAHVSVCFYKTS